MAVGEIDNLTMKQYLALTPGNQAPGVVKPEIGGNVYFKTKSHFMRELREDTFSGSKNDNAHDHVERVLDIISFFNIPGVTHDAVMRRIFPITLTGAAKRNINSSSSNFEGIVAFVRKLDSLGGDMKKIKENVHVIQVGCQLYRGAHLDKECPLNEEVKSVEEASRIRLFIKGKKNGRMMLDSINNGPLVYLTVKENSQTRPKKYSELTEAHQLQDDCDVQAINIIFHGLPPEVLYNLFDKFASVQGETLYEYYWRFSHLINDMHTIGMTMQQVQVNTMFPNALPLEWSKFITNVKLAKSLYTTTYDQLYAYLSQHERHANEVRIMCKRYPDPLALVANSQTLYNPSQSPQHSGSSMYPPPQYFTSVYVAPIHHQHHYTSVNPLQQSVSSQPFISPSVIQQSQAENTLLDSGLAVPTFEQGEDLIDCINKAMAFLSVVASRNKGIATTSRGKYAASQEKEKLMLVEAQEAGQILDEEKLAFIADNGIEKVPQNSAFQTEDLDAYDSDCDDISLAKAVLMVNLLSYDSDVLSKVAYSDTYLNDMINQDVQEMMYSEHTHIVDFPDSEITSDSNIIPYS
ncbi:hypothetical protein Tco_0096748 [Tanacetum coccineum]